MKMELKRVKLKNGYLVFDSDYFLLINEKNILSEKNSEQNFAGVIEVKNADMPHYLFLSNTPLNDLSYQEEEQLIDLLCNIVPELQDIRKQEVKPEFTSAGVLRNMHQWIVSPLILIYEIQELEDEQQLANNNNVGIIRRSDFYGL